jgi:hypothetical protein
MTGWLEEIGRLRREVASPLSAPGGVEAVHEAVVLAHRAASQLQTLDDWTERLDCTGAALHLNLAEVELREALAGSRWVARPVRLRDFPPSDARAVIEGVVTLLRDVQRALVAAVGDGGILTGVLPAARAIIDVGEARAALRGELLV